MECSRPGRVAPRPAQVDPNWAARNTPTTDCQASPGRQWLETIRRPKMKWSLWGLPLEGATNPFRRWRTPTTPSTVITNSTVNRSQANMPPKRTQKPGRTRLQRLSQNCRFCLKNQTIRNSASNMKTRRRKEMPMMMTIQVRQRAQRWGTLENLQSRQLSIWKGRGESLTYTKCIPSSSICTRLLRSPSMHQLVWLSLNPSRRWGLVPLNSPRPSTTKMRVTKN